MEHAARRSPSAAGAPSPERRGRVSSLATELAVAAAVCALAFAAFAPALRAWFLADDFFVLEITRPEPPWRRFLLPQYLFFEDRFEAVQMHGRPFLLATFAIQQAWTGLEPLPMRAFNVLALAVAGCFVWRLARGRLALPGTSAFLAAALFVLHPEHVDGVAWIAGRGAPLSTALVLGALLLWLRGARAAPALLFLVALGVYELAVCFPLLVLVIEGRRAARDRWLLALIGVDLAFCVLQLGFLSDVPRVGWNETSPVHALRHVFQLAWPFFDSPRFAFYNVTAKDRVREHLVTAAPLAFLVLLASCVLVWRWSRAWRRTEKRLLAAACLALLPALAYGHFSPRTSTLASAFFVLLVASLSRRRVVWLAIYAIALGAATFDECRFWDEGAARSREIVQRSARGERVDPPQHHGKLVPLFPGRATLETALRVFPDGPPP